MASRERLGWLAGAGWGRGGVAWAGIPRVRVGTVVGARLCPGPRGQAAQMCQSLSCHEDVRVGLRVVDVADQRHDTRDGPALGSGRREEHRDEGVAGEVA